MCLVRLNTPQVCVRTRNVIANCRRNHARHATPTSHRHALPAELCTCCAAAAAEEAAAARPPVDMAQQEADKAAARAAIRKTGVTARDKMRELLAEALAMALPDVVSTPVPVEIISTIFYCDK